MVLAFYVTLNELRKGGEDCEITRQRPTKEPYVKVLIDSAACAYRGKNYVFYKDTKLAGEMRNGPRGSDWEDLDRGPTIGLLDDALEEAIKLGIL